MSIAYKCDICGVLFEGMVEAGGISIAGEHYDCCKNCHNKIKDFILELHKENLAKNEFVEKLKERQKGDK